MARKGKGAPVNSHPFSRVVHDFTHRQHTATCATDAPQARRDASFDVSTDNVKAGIVKFYILVGKPAWLAANGNDAGVVADRRIQRVAVFGQVDGGTDLVADPDHQHPGVTSVQLGQRRVLSVVAFKQMAGHQRRRVRPDGGERALRVLAADRATGCAQRLGDRSGIARRAVHVERGHGPQVLLDDLGGQSGDPGLVRTGGARVLLRGRQHDDVAACADRLPQCRDNRFRTAVHPPDGAQRHVGEERLSLGNA